MESNLNITKRNGRYIEPNEWSPFADEAVPSSYYSNYAANPYGSAMFNPTGLSSGDSPSRGLSPQKSTTSKRNRGRDGMATMSATNDSKATSHRCPGYRKNREVLTTRASPETKGRPCHRRHHQTQTRVQLTVGEHPWTGRESTRDP
ncbi:hypothetical protein HDE_04454 [Halotydeus destructor]|nr:hypothetical protein HDE_04454 [Halotydeus destructor]